MSVVSPEMDTLMFPDPCPVKEEDATFTTYHRGVVYVLEMPEHPERAMENIFNTLKAAIRAATFEGVSEHWWAEDRPDLWISYDPNAEDGWLIYRRPLKGYGDHYS